MGTARELVAASGSWLEGSMLISSFYKVKGKMYGLTQHEAEGSRSGDFVGRPWLNG